MGKSLLAGALSISILTLPLITTTTEDAIRGLPEGYLQGSLGMGATKWQSVFHVLLPACLPRIMTGVILAAGRGFGEAAALLYTAGSGTYRLMDKIQTWPTLLRPCCLYWYWPSALVLMLYQDIFKQKTRVKGDKYVEY